MRGGLPPIAEADAFRVRRWDALILGSALPGLVAAARLAQRGLRVLILEETSVEGDELDREPFLLSDADPDGVLNECLRALGVPLIDQRRFVSEEVALQICDSERRVDLGRGSHTAEEWSSWGLSTPEQAREWVDSLEQAAEAERQALLRGQLSLRATQRARGALGGARRSLGERGWPRSFEQAPDALRTLLDAPLRALSNLGERAPSGEARARLLGGLLRGGVSLSGSGGQLRALLRRRVEALYGEFRGIDAGFRLVSAKGMPGIAVEGSKEIWTGRALILNAPAAAIAAAQGDDAPELLRAAPIRRRRHTVHLRGPQEQLSPCMAERVVWCDPERQECVALRLFRGRRRDERFDLLASVVVDAEGDAIARGEDRIECALRDLLPFSEGALERAPGRALRWDDDALLADPSGPTWPEEPELRVSSKPAVYALERAAVGGLGGEGELWLGWRGGDAIGEELA